MRSTRITTTVAEVRIRRVIARDDFSRIVWKAYIASPSSLSAIDMARRYLLSSQGARRWNIDPFPKVVRSIPDGALVLAAYPTYEEVSI